MEELHTAISERRARPRGGPLSVGLIASLLIGAIASIALWVNAQHWQEEAAAQQAQAQQQRQRADRETQQAQQLQQQVTVLQRQNQDLKTTLAAPTLSIWNSCGGPCTVGPDKVRVGGVPDTFEFHVSYNATVPVALYFMTFHQWTQFDSCGFQLSCVVGSYDSYAANTSRDIRFTKATGCAGYVFVLAATSNGTITPNVEATYRPADHPTGVCSSTP